VLYNEYNRSQVILASYRKRSCVGEADEKYPVPEGFAEDYGRAWELIDEEEYEEAEALLEGILERVPDHPRVTFALGVVSFHAHTRTPGELGGFRKAEELLMKAIELGPDLAEAYSFLGVLYMRTGRRREASELIDTAVRLKVKSAEIWNSIGLYFALDGNYTEALDYFLVAYTINPEYYVAAYNAGCAYARFGDTESAIEYLKAGLRSKRLINNVDYDPDFDSIRNLPEFKKVISAAKKRFGAA
jgi:tetratricopeptide (TPR) repeat protein